MREAPGIDNDDPLLTQQQAAEYLGLSERTLEDWRQPKKKRGKCGPAFIRLGRLVRYRKSALDTWLQKRTVQCDAA